MALLKEIIKPNGVKLGYHRISMIKMDTNQQITLLIDSYIDETGRDYEKKYANGEIEGEPIFPYVDSEYITIPYDPDMTAEKAYKTVKTLPEFEEADDAFDEWNGNSVKYSKGDYISYNGKIYKVLQSHISQPDWTPVEAVSLFLERPDPRIDYAEFIQPTGAHDVYNQGDKVTYNGSKYESVIDNNAWSPDTYPAGWKKTEDSTEGPGSESGEETGEEKYPEFVQPSGSHNAYSKGDRIIYNGDAYESLLDGNAWSPDAYPAGWKKL